MPSRSSCKIEAVLDVISDQWTLAIIHELTVGPRRTVELHAAFEGMSTKTLAARLKKLQRHGLVKRTVYGESPPRVEYLLTEKGGRLGSVLSVVAEIAEEWNQSVPEIPNRQPCRACEIRATEEREEATGSKEINTTKLRRSEPETSPDPRPPALNDVTLL